nr:MerR family transcriptional regulator [Enhydrobacter aerosaccus]
MREAARKLQVSARMLRHYEAAGLLRAARLDNGYRSLSEADVQRAAWVRDLIAAGFSTREVRALAAALDAGAGPPICTAALRNKLEQIDRLVDALTNRRRRVAERLVRQQQAVAASSTSDHGKEGPGDGNPEHSGAPVSAPGRPR